MNNNTNTPIDNPFVGPIDPDNTPELPDLPDPDEIGSQTPLEFILGIVSNPYIQRILISIIIVVVIYFLRLIINRIIHKRLSTDIKKYHKIRKLISYISFIIGIFAIGSLWLRFFNQVMTTIGLISAGIAFIFKEALTNLAGWFFIVWRKPFQIGDRIQVSNVSGDVIDIRLFQITLMEIRNWVDADQSTGRIIHIPNSKVFTTEIANYGKGFKFIWNELPVTVTFESDWKKAKEILLEIINRHAEGLSKSAEEKLMEASRRYMIFYTKLTPIVYTKVIDIGVTLTIRYLCSPRRRRTSESVIWEDILTLFHKTPGITFAYPTQRFFYNPAEGKIRNVPTPEDIVQIPLHPDESDSNKKKENDNNNK